MTKFQNMKIEINEQQPLDEVVRELERLGYHGNIKTGNVVVSSYFGKFAILDLCESKMYKPTTLAQLKAMEK